MATPTFKSLTVKFTPELVSELASYSAANSIKLSESVRRAVVAMLDGYKAATVKAELASVSVPDLIVGFDAALAACDAAPFSARAGMLQHIIEDLHKYHPAFTDAADGDPTLTGEFRRLALTARNKADAKVSKDDVMAEIKSREPAQGESLCTENPVASPEELAHFDLPEAFNDTYSRPFTRAEGDQIMSNINWYRGRLGQRGQLPPVGESEIGMAHLLWNIERYEFAAPDSDRLAQLKEFRDTGTYTQVAHQ